MACRPTSDGVLCVGSTKDPLKRLRNTLMASGISASLLGLPDPSSDGRLAGGIACSRAAADWREAGPCPETGMRGRSDMQRAHVWMLAALQQCTGTHSLQSMHMNRQGEPSGLIKMHTGSFRQQTLSFLGRSVMGRDLHGRYEGSRGKAGQTSSPWQACMFMGDKLSTPCTTFKLCCEISRLIMDPERSGCG